MLHLPTILTHPHALDTALLLKAKAAMQTQSVVVDAAALTQFDSSALAVLLAVRREALSKGKTFAVHGLPARLRQLAGLYGVSELVPAEI